MSELFLGGVALAIALLIALISAEGRTRKQRVLIALVIVGFLVSLLGLINSHISKQRGQEETDLQKLSGALQPGIQPTPRLLYDPPLPPETDRKARLIRTPSNEVAVFLGTNVVVSTTDSNFVIFRVFGSNLVTVTRTNNQLFISCEIRSEDGRFIAQIRNNQFHVNPVNYFRIERPDRSTLSVFEQTGGRVLSVEFLNPLAIRMSGTFRAINGKEAVLVTDEYVEFSKIQLFGFAFHLSRRPLFDWPIPAESSQGVWIFDQKIRPLVVLTSSGGGIESEFSTRCFVEGGVRVVTGDMKFCALCRTYLDQSAPALSNAHVGPLPHP
jgi:hypothetical protein